MLLDFDPDIGFDDPRTEFSFVFRFALRLRVVQSEVDAKHHSIMCRLSLPIKKDVML